MNCLSNCFLKYYPKLVYDLRHLNRFNLINGNIFRQLNESSNQRIISLQTNTKLNSDLSQTNTTNNLRNNSSKVISDKTKANIKVTFVRNDGKRMTGFGKEGDSLLDVVVDNDMDLDGFGACEGTLACSTCHLIFTSEDYNKISCKPTDEELDMLDLAFELCETSRLGCQVILTKDFDGLEVRVPAGVNDVRTT